MLLQLPTDYEVQYPGADGAGQPTCSKTVTADTHELYRKQYSPRQASLQYS